MTADDRAQHAAYVRRWNNDPNRPVVLCACGCGRPVRTRRARYLNGHSRSKPLPLIERDDLLWLAGLAEGEASFVLSVDTRRGADHRYARFQLAMKDEDVVARVAGLLGCTYSRREPEAPNRAALYRVQYQSAGAATLMRMLLPLMGQRRQAQIRAVLDGLLPVP